MPKGKEAIEELRAMRANIDAAISALEQVYAARADQIGETTKVMTKDDYSRMSLRAGALEAVMNSHEPKSTQAIVDLLIAGGLRSKSKALGRNVYTTLYGLSKAPESKIERTEDGKWVKK